MQPFNTDNLRAYTLIRREELPDIHAEGILLKHNKSGARVALLPADDNNKVFNIAFRTPPEDSTGVAHIIEHTVLCGSEKFPLKDPFVELIKGSLNTFLNAMTYPDKTMYPVASTNDADFRNLMHVYLDAVFHPNIYREKNIFRQEGWHYEMEDADQPLTINGVVYNEMKGAYSTPESVLERETMNALFPDTAYGVDSGGNPVNIPDLTYENYLDFHRRYYHPSNSYICLYGDLDMADALAFLDEEYLSGYDVLEIDSEVRRQEPFTEVLRLERDYPVSEEDPLEDNSYLSYNIVTGDCLDMREMIACEVLDYALLSAPGAPVKQALLDAGIGKSVSGGFSDGVLQPYFSINSKNASPEQADAFEATIRRVLREQAEGGINRGSLLAGLNTLEFQFREADYSSFPKGLMYEILLMDTWLYSEEEAFTALKKLDAIAWLRERIDTGWFENFIREKLLANRHAVLMTLNPKRGLTEETEEALKEALEERKAGMSPDEISRIVNETAALHAWQEEPETEENIASLPVLKISDIGKEAVRISNEEEIISVNDSSGAERQVKIIWHNASSNGIAYVDLCFDIGDIGEEELPYVSLLRAMLQNVSTKTHSYLELGNEINARTGGIVETLGTFGTASPEGTYSAYYMIRAKALYPKLSDCMALLREILTESLFDDAKRILEVISQQRAGLQMGMQQMGNAIAAIRGLAAESSQSAWSDLTGGIAYYRFISDIEENYSERKDALRSHLEALYARIFCCDRLLLSFTCEEEARELLRAHVGGVVFAQNESMGTVPIDSSDAQNESAGTVAPGSSVKVRPYGRVCEAFTTAGQIQFVTMSGNFASRGFKYSGALVILQQILTFDYLWQNIRVKGGAYGCGANFKRNGDAMFTTFRDPNLAASKDVFLGIPEYIRNFEADDNLMTKYIIGTVSGLDTPLTPSMLGAVSLRCYLQGTTQEELQRTRDEVLSASDEDIRGLAPLISAVLDADNLCVIGGLREIEKSRDLFGRIEGLL